MSEMQRLSPELRKADATAAQTLLDDRIFMKAILDLRKQWFGELMNEETPRKQDILVAKLKSLEDIPLQLQSYVNAQKMAMKSA
jgi:hypothetical protein